MKVAKLNLESERMNAVGESAKLVDSSVVLAELGCELQRHVWKMWMTFVAAVLFACLGANTFGEIDLQTTDQQTTDQENVEQKSTDQTSSEDPTSDPLSTDPATDLEKAAAKIEAELAQTRTSTVGYPKLISQHVIEGPKVVAKPVSDRTQALIVRIVETFAHGEHFRYDIEYKAFEAGKYNLTDFLKREDGSDDPIPKIEVEVTSLLGAGQVLPHELPPKKTDYRSYYLPLLLAGATIWIAGLLLILFYGRGKKRRPTSLQQKLTVADRLRPLVDSAVDGKLDSREQAELERVLNSFWSKKLRLTHLPADAIRQQLRQHSEASVLLQQIDSWLHKPASDPTNQVDIDQILSPYQSMNYDDIN